MKLPRNLKTPQVTEVNRRLKALGTMNLPIPKGPMPQERPDAARAPRLIVRFLRRGRPLPTGLA